MRTLVVKMVYARETSKARKRSFKIQNVINFSVGWFKQCPPSGECIPHSIVHPSKLPWEIDIIKSITLRNLVPILFIIYFILFFTFILHLLVCYPTIDSLVFAFFMVSSVMSSQLILRCFCINALKHSWSK